MSAFAELEILIGTIADRLGIAPCKVPLQPLAGFDFHLVPKGDRFDLVHQTDESRCESALGLEDAAYELVFVAALSAAMAEERALRQGVACRWNWIGPHIMLMERARPAWGEKCRAHYRRILTREPLSEGEIAAIRPGLLRPGSDF